MSADGIQSAKLAVGLEAKDARLVRRKNAASFGEGKRDIFPSTPVILAYSATRANYIAHYANRIRLAFVSQPRLRFSPFLVLVDVVFRAARRAAPPRIATTNAQSPVFPSLSSSSPTFTVCASVLHPPSLRYYRFSPKRSNICTYVFLSSSFFISSLIALLFIRDLPGNSYCKKLNSLTFW